MRSVSASVLVGADPATVLAELVDVDGMRRWWGVDRGLIDARKGGVWALAWDVSRNGFRYAMSGTIARYDLGHELRIAQLLYFNAERAILGPMELAFVVRPDSSGALLTVRQDGYREGGDWDWYHDEVSEAWPVTLSLLQEYVQQRRAAAASFILAHRNKPQG